MRGVAGPVMVTIMATAFLTGCAVTLTYTGAVGKKSQALVREPGLCNSNKPDQTLTAPAAVKGLPTGRVVLPSTKVTEHTIDRTIGADEKIVTTEPAPPPPVAESRGGKIPSSAWWTGLWCFVSPTC